MLFSTAYFPPISYFAKFLCNENIIIDNYEHYVKQTFRNRCKIYTANGPLFLSVPVSKGGLQKICTKDVTIDYSLQWQKIHWRSIESAYNNSPFFLYYRDELEQRIFSNQKFLVDLNNQIIETVCKQLHIGIIIQFSEKYIDTGIEKNDFRNTISPKIKQQKQLPFYQQVFSDKYGFASDLSVIDLLFNLGPDSKEYLKKITNNNNQNAN